MRPGQQVCVDRRILAPGVVPTKSTRGFVTRQFSYKNYRGIIWTDRRLKNIDEREKCWVIKGFRLTNKGRILVIFSDYQLSMTNTSNFFLQNEQERVLTTKNSCILIVVTICIIPPIIKFTIDQTGLGATENRKRETSLVNKKVFVNVLRPSDAYMHQ